MAETFKTLYRGQLPITAAVIYTAPVGTGLGAVAKIIRVRNTSTSQTIAFTLYKNGTTGPYEFAGVILGPGDTYKDPDGITLGSGETLAGKADVASTLTCLVDGMEIS